MAKCSAGTPGEQARLTHLTAAAMPAQTLIRVVDVYPYRVTGAQPEFLLLRRAAVAAYAGTWRMIGGKIEADETAWQTALREVEEETGQRPGLLWTVPSINAFYEWQHDRLNLIPAFAARLDADPVLDDEHDAFGWHNINEAVEALCWPEQQRLLRVVAEVVRAGIPPELIITAG